LNHADVKQNLSDYLEGDLPLETRARVDAHLDACSECAREVDEMQRTIGLLRTLPDPETPPMITANVMRRIRAGETEPNWFGRIARAFSDVAEPSFVLPASAIAVAALVAMAIQDPSALGRFQFAQGSESTPAAIDVMPFAGNSGRSASSGGLGRLQSVRPRPASEISGPDLNMRWPFDGGTEQVTQEGTQGRTTLALPASPLASSSLAARSAVPGAAAGSMRFHVEFDGSSARGALRVAPTSPATEPLASLASRSAPLWNNGWNIGARATPGPTERFAAAGGSQAGWARRVAQPSDGVDLLARSHSGTFAGAFTGTESSGGEDPRDAWLARGLERPADFARFLAGKNLAEHELWVSRLAQRAEEQNVLDELVAALRASGDVSAAILSDDFAAHADTLVDHTRDHAQDHIQGQTQGHTQGQTRDWSAPTSR
jgi:hypothetical protein